jgi:hypothetical protein
MRAIPASTVLLTLVEGIIPATPEDRETRDVELELTLRDGRFEPTVWGYAVHFNRADHEGKIVRIDGDKLWVKLALNPDKWFPKTAGEAEYELTLKREGDHYTGSFTGTFAYPGKEGPVKSDVRGKITGKLYPLWSEPAPSFKRLEPQEHPRLVFRKSDLPLLQKRLKTPQGKAILKRFLAMLPQQHVKDGKCAPYFPAGYGLAYQLTGDKAHAQRAKELLAGMLHLGGSQEIHYGPLAQSIAVTLDFCYDAWDPAFRQTVIDNLAQRTINLYTGEGVGAYSVNPWHNKQGVWAPSAGVAALCLLGEKTSNGQEVPGLERMIHRLARDTRRYFQFNGTSNSGWCLEGQDYKRMTWNSGPGHLIQAYRSALGGDLLAGWWGHWSILGQWMEQPPASPVVVADDLGNFQYSGLWPLGLVSVPSTMKAGARWLYDHAFGLEGNQTFGIFWAYHAAYVLMNYPFETDPKPPAKSLPWVAPDPTGGHWIFRKSWEGKNDSLVVLQLRSNIQRGCHYERSGRTWDMQLFALGKQWVGSRTLVEKDPSPGVALPMVSNPGAYNSVLGAITTDWSASQSGQASLSLDMTPVYLQALVSGEKPPTNQKTATVARFGTFIDHGVRVQRALALDLSGASGVPVLLVLVDQSQGAHDFTWNLKLADEVGTGKVEGNTVTVGDPLGVNLTCTFIGPKPQTITGAIQATGSADYFAVITVQRGRAPALQIEGEGLAARVRVGRQRIHFEGGKLVWQ